ncbi:MAG: hypothetical protein GY707_05570 [Desulfobacteraceae bacterium]|nr:hypothetical protein [Desulfobacteraceae bacterium]
MKQVTLERTLNVPDADYCIQWKGETCPLLHFRKDPKNPKMLWRCEFFDVDLVQNLNSIGIKKFCMTHEPGDLYYIDSSKINLK